MPDIRIQRTIQLTSGHGEITSPFADVDEAIEALKGTKKAQRDDFAQDLIRKHKRYGLTDNQKPWAHKLAAEATGHLTDDSLRIEGFSHLVDRFDQTGMERPKLRFGSVGPDGVRFSQTSGGSEPGSIVVTSDEAYQSNTFYGRIHRDGEFEGRGEVPEHVQDLLERLQDDPEAVMETALTDGQETGTCSCCGRKLTDPESVERGVGPVCASKWGF